MSDADEAERPEWQHHEGDTYIPVFGDYWGNPEDGYRHEWSTLSPPHNTQAQAQRAGFEQQGSDDFNIAVKREGSVVALLWMNEDMSEESAVLADLTDHLWPVTP